MSRHRKEVGKREHGRFGTIIDGDYRLAEIELS
jgi:hypothetical protein